jgi:glycosyltransferase involved in cell wall biosynthesis
LFDLSGGGGRTGAIRRTRTLVAERAPDLIHTTLFEADVAGRSAGALTRVPVVSSLVNMEYGPEQFADPRIKAWKLRGAEAVDIATARLVTRFHAITEHVADVMHRRLHVPRAKIDVIPRGRDPRILGERTEARRSQARRLLGIDTGVPLLLAVARQEHQKGLDVLVAALPAILDRRPETILVIAGREGGATAELRAQIARLGLDNRVRFLGARDDVADLMCAADAFVLPSRWEGLGSVLIEAMGMQVPIVASDLPPIVETVPRDMAILVPPERSNELAGAILDVVDRPDAARFRAASAYRRFHERYTVARVAEAMIAFYDRCLAKDAISSTRAFHSGRNSPSRS